MYRKTIRTSIGMIPLALLIFLSAFTPREQVYEGGGELYLKKCAKCHGKDGTKGFFGAKNLQITRLDDDGYRQVITAGRNRMPAWEKKLSAGQINLVIQYVKALRK